jgi:hypothetical protein
MRLNNQFFSTEGNEGNEGPKSEFAIGAITLDNWIDSPGALSLLRYRRSL